MAKIKAGDVVTVKAGGSATGKTGVVVEYVQTYRGQDLWAVLLNDATVEHLASSGLEIRK